MSGLWRGPPRPNQRRRLAYPAAPGLDHVEYYAESAADGVADPSVAITGVSWKAGDTAFLWVTGRSNNVVQVTASTAAYSLVPRDLHQDVQGAVYAALLVSDPIVGSGTGQTITVFIDTGGAAHTGGVNAALFIVSGTNPALDAYAVADTGAVDDNTPTVNLTTAHASVRVFALFQTRDRTFTVDAADGFTLIRANDQVSTSTNISSLSDYYRDQASTTGTYNASGTTASSANDWIAATFSVYAAPFPTQSVTLPLLSSGGATYSATIVADSPRAYWRLGESSGNAADSSGNGHTAVATGTPGYSATGLLTGDADTAVTFVAADLDGFVAPTSAGLEPTSALSIEAWVKFTGSAGNTYDVLRYGDGSNGYWLRRPNFGSDILQFRINASGGASEVYTGSINDGVRHHVVATWDGSAQNIYVDGSLVSGPSGTSGTMLYASQDVGIGIAGNAVSEPFDGTIDEVALYGVALTPTQISAHYAAGTGGGGGGATVYAPTVVQTSATIALPLLDASNALYAPTVAAQPVTVTLGLLTSTSAVYAPTLATVNAIAVPLLDAAPAVYAPTVNTIQYLTVPLLDAARATYAPTVAQAGGAAQGLTVPLLESGGADYASTVLADSPVGYWRMDESSGNAIDDAGSNDLTFSGTPTYGQATGVTGGNTAIDFTSSAYASGSSVTLPTGAISVEAWLRLTSIPSGLDTGIGQSLSAIGVLFYLSDSGGGSIYFFINANELHGAILSGDSQWHHYVATWDGTNGRIYKDGSLVVGPTAVAGPLGSNAGAPFQIGTYANGAGGHGIPGRADEVAYYNVALSAGQVAAHYAAGTGAAPAPALYAPGVVQGTARITVPLLDSGPAVYAPTVAQASGAQSLTLATLYSGPFDPNVFDPTVFDTGPFLYALTVTPASVAQSLTVPLLDSGPTTYAPSISVTVTVPLLTSTATLYAPTVSTVNILTVPLLDASAAVYAPTLVPTALTIVVPALDAANALYAPLVYQDQFVTVPLLDSGPTLYSPTVSTVNAIALPTAIDGAATVYAPTLVGKNTLTVPLLDAGPVLYQPEVQPDQFVTLALLDGAPAVYAPTIAAAAYTLTVPLLDAANALYAPTVYQDVFVTVPLLDAGPTVYAPTMAQGGSLALTLLDSSPTLYAPTVYQDVFIDLGLLDSGSALYGPTLTVGAVAITLGAPIDAARAVFAPTVTAAALTVVVPFLDAVDAVYAPTLAVGAVTLSLPVLDGAPAVYAPSVTSGSTLVVPLLSSSPTTYAPTVVPGFVSLTVPLLDSGPTVYAPSLSATLTVPLLDGARAVYSPTLSGINALALGTIDAGRDLYDPRVSYRQLVELPLLDAARATYAPVIALALPGLPEDAIVGIVLDPIAGAGVALDDIDCEPIIVLDPEIEEVPV